jgi:predicted phosphodiesterase
MAIYGVLGDIHGNIEALQAALAALDARGVERIACVGDIVGYNADPDACVEALRARGAVAIAGNHDLIGTGRLGFERCSNKAMHSLKRTRRALAPASAAYLAALAPSLVIEDRVVLVHGGVRDVQQYMTQPKHVLENVRYLREDFPGMRLCFFGHTHEQRVFEVIGDEVRTVPPSFVDLSPHREYFVNPGSVDAARKHGPKYAEYLVFDTEALTLDFGHVPYDDRRSEARAFAGGYRIARWRDRLYDVQRRLTLT